MKKALTGPADLRDAKRLAELEVVIERGKAAFIETGTALLEVRESRLYRLGYGTFDDYLAKRWPDISRSYAYRLMDRAEVARVLSPIGDIPNEAQARELAPILRSDGPEAVAEVMAEAVRRTEGRPTARVIREVVADTTNPVNEDEIDLDAGPNEEARAAAYIDALKGYISGVTRVQPPTLGDPPALYRRRHALERRLLDVLAEVMA